MIEWVSVSVSKLMCQWVEKMAIHHPTSLIRLYMRNYLYNWQLTSFVILSCFLPWLSHAPPPRKFLLPPLERLNYPQSLKINKTRLPRHIPTLTTTKMLYQHLCVYIDGHIHMCLIWYTGCPIFLAWSVHHIMYTCYTLAGRLWDGHKYVYL